MATMTIGPVTGKYRRAIAAAAFRLGLEIHETKGCLSTSFDVRGSAEGVKRLHDAIERVQRKDRWLRHTEFVLQMQDDEGRRARWARLIGRRPRREPLTRAESLAVMGFIGGLREHSDEIDRETAKRLIDQYGLMYAAAGTAGNDRLLGEIAAVGMRYLQQDVRLKNVRVPRAMRREILSMRVPMEQLEI